MDQSDFRLELSSPEECMTFADFERYSDGRIEPQRLVRLEGHLANCPTCRTELGLFQEFTDGTVRPEESAAVDRIECRLAARWKPAENRREEPQRVPWWRTVFAFPSLRMASFAGAALLAIVTGFVYVHNEREPGLQTELTDNVVWRSNRLEAVSPLGDLRAAPSELVWKAAPGAQRYRVQILEVDHNVLWRGETSEPRLAINADVVEKFAVSKTVLWEVSAVDGTGRALAQSGLQTFRVARN